MTRRTRLLAGAGLAALAALAHLPALEASFLADDYVMLRSAERVTDPAWPFSRNDFGEADDAGHFYRPVWLLWNTAIHALFGEAAWTFHAGNLLLFAAITVGVWQLLRRLAGEAPALVAAAAFAVYPRHSESVAWISGNTDLVASALVVAALLCATARWALGARVGTAAALAALAALAKEIAFVAPLLALLVLVVRRRSRGERVVWLVPAAMAAAQAGVFTARLLVLGGLGGYYGYDWTPSRAVAAAVSYTVGAVTPQQLDVVRWPALLVVPLLLAGLAVWAVARAWRHGERTLVAAGAVWFAATIVPVLNLGLDLTTANGERLLFLPSVGLAIALAGVLPGRFSRVGAAGAAVALVAALVLSLDAARNWATAGEIADRVVASTLRVAPNAGELVLLSVPESYKNAHVLRLGLDAAVGLAGLDRRTAWCAPVQVLEQTRGAVRFVKLPDGSYDGATTWAAPFTFPLSGAEPLPLTPDCTYEERDDAADAGRGRALAAKIQPNPRVPAAAFAYFDGYDVRPFLPSAR